MKKINIGVVGFGKIAHDQHMPAVAANPDFELVAVTAGPHAAPAGVAVFETLEAMIGGTPSLAAVSLCTPPQGRCELARHALRRGLHVLMEKPPGQSLSEVEDLIGAARSRSVALFATWHSREAPAVEIARRWAATGRLLDVVVTWKEDVRRWHPGQAWIWQPGGFGVFDPGINALSILTRIMPRIIFPTAARLDYPENRHMPIAAVLDLTDSLGTPIRAEFDWREQGAQTWDIVVTADSGRLHLRAGGTVLSLDGRPVELPPAAEYPGLYRRFAELVRVGGIDVDVAPLRIVADAFTIGERRTVAPFDD